MSCITHHFHINFNTCIGKILSESFHLHLLHFTFFKPQNINNYGSWLNQQLRSRQTQQFSLLTELQVTTLIVPAFKSPPRLLSDDLWQLSNRWIKIIILTQYFNILVCVNLLHCSNVSSTKDYNQLNIYGNGIASSNTGPFPLTFCTHYIFRHLMMFLPQTWTFW